SGSQVPGGAACEDVPQFAQNLAPAASSLPQPVQNFFCTARVLPHSAQNFPPGCLVLHLGHVTWVPPGVNWGCCWGLNCGWAWNEPAIMLPIPTPTAICAPAPARPSPTPCAAIPCPAPMSA